MGSVVLKWRWCLRLPHFVHIKLRQILNPLLISPSMAGFLSTLRRLYLTLYNWTLFFGWYLLYHFSFDLSSTHFSQTLTPSFRVQVFYFCIKQLKESGHQHVYNAVERPLQFSQTAAVLEVCPYRFWVCWMWADYRFTA